MEKYTVIGLSIYEHEYTDEENMDRLENFLGLLRSVGVEADGRFKKDSALWVRFIGDWREDGYGVMEDLNECIDCLAIKDGVDFVQYSDGSLGCVAYYNGLRDAVKIIRNMTDKECEEVYDEL